MSAQLSLVARPVPPTLEGIDLRCCDVGELLKEANGAQLVIADPPWSEYTQRPGVSAAPDLHYPVLSLESIAQHISSAHDAAASDARLLLWGCWPLLPEALSVLGPWKFKTGGSWHKLKSAGVGFHWRGRSEFAIVATKGAPKRPSITLANAHASKPAAHSEKPIGWALDHVQAWSEPGALVLDLYAGMGPYARACALEGRRYLGAEIDPSRHLDALSLLSRVRKETG